MPPTPGDSFSSHCTEAKTEGLVGHLAAQGHLASELSYSDQSLGVANNVTQFPFGGAVMGETLRQAIWAAVQPGPRCGPDWRWTAGAGGAQGQPHAEVPQPTHWDPQTGPRPVLRPQTSPDLLTGPGAPHVTLADATDDPSDRTLLPSPRDK